MGYLDSLAGGLRAAAGIVSPDAQKQIVEEDQRNTMLRAQQQQIVLQNLARQVESGAMPQEQAAQVAQQVGLPAQLVGGPSMEAQARKQALDNEMGFRQAVSESNGDIASIANAAMRYGKPDIAVTIFNRQEDRAARLQDRRDQIAARERELQMRLEDKTLDREMRERLGAESNALKQQQLALQGEIARGNQELQRLRIEMMGDKKLQETERKKFQTTQQLGVAFEKANLPQMSSVLESAESATKDDKILEWVNGPKSAVPDLVAPKEAVEARQAVQKLFNITLKDRSGAAVTNQELERLRKEFGQGVFKTPDQLRTALGQARRIIEDHYRGIAAGFGKDALDNYNKNMEEIGGKVFLRSGGSAATSAPSMPKVGEVRDGYKFKGGDPSKPESWEKQ